MTGTWINAGLILLGSLAGVLVGPRLPENMKKALMTGMGICILVIGIQDALESENIILVLASVVLGGILGSLTGIERRLQGLGDRLQARLKGKWAFGEGFVNASLIFCVGAMAVTGSLQDGLKGDPSTLIAKGVIDGVMSVVLAGTMGPGVALSALAVLIYQGSISLLAGTLQGLLTARTVAEMTAVGGVLIIGIGLNQLCAFGDRRVPVGDLLPAVFCPLLLTLVM